MIDVHSHILPNVDDGSRSLEESMKMLEALNKASFNTVFVTPHVTSKRPVTLDNGRLEKKFQTLLASIKNKGLNLKLYKGSEFDAHRSTHHELKHGFTLAGSKVVLVDLSFAKDSYEEVLYNLIVLGYKVMIAHVERYDFLNIQVLKAIKSNAIYLQMNLNSLYKNAPKKQNKRAKKLLKAGLIDSIGTDAHRYYPDFFEDLQYGLNECRKLVDDDKFKHITGGFVKEVILDG